MGRFMIFKDHKMGDPGSPITITRALSKGGRRVRVREADVMMEAEVKVI